MVIWSSNGSEEENGLKYEDLRVLNNKVKYFIDLWNL